VAGEPDRLIPPILGFRSHWLIDAEASFVDGGHRAGLSLYFLDPLEFEAFAEVAGLPQDAVAREFEFRRAFDLDPRIWIKLHFRDGAPDGFSQYFVIDPRIDYPVTTLRVLGRRLGLTRADRVEPAFQRALTTPGTLFAVIAKVGAGVSPRLSARLPRPLLPEVLADFAAVGFLSQSARQGLIDAERQVSAGDWAYLSVDPETPDAVAIDLEAPVDWPGVRYLKLRLRQGVLERATYHRATELWSSTEILAATGTGVPDARTYYEANAREILDHYGHTYQTGTFSADAGEHNRALVARAGVRAGARVLDAGCGAGGPACDLLSSVKGTSVVGVTISKVQAEAAQALAEARDVANRAAFIVADYRHLPFGEAEFDHVMFLESLGYAEDLRAPLEEAARVLRPGGRLYVKDVFRQREVTLDAELELAEFQRLYGYHPIAPEALVSALRQSGFVDLELRPFGEEMTSEPFHRAMFPNGLPSAFGRRHHRAFSRLPLAFGDLLAIRS